jgi:uncharacterized protein YycO
VVLKKRAAIIQRELQYLNKPIKIMAFTIVFLSEERIMKHKIKNNSRNNLKRLFSTVMVFAVAFSLFFAVSLVPKSDYASASAGVSKHWYDDIDLNTPLRQLPNYSKHHLLTSLKPGDIIYDPSGFGGITGHILSVEGVFHDSNFNVDYVRAIEATGYVNGTSTVEKVMRSIVDDSRFDAQGFEVYRVNTSDAVRNNAVQFQTAQLSKPYTFNYTSFNSLNLNDLASTGSWYCSELAWASYRAQGIDIRNDRWSKTPFVVTPRDITSFAKNGAVTEITNY